MGKKAEVKTIFTVVRVRLTVVAIPPFSHEEHISVSLAAILMLASVFVEMQKEYIISKNPHSESPALIHLLQAVFVHISLKSKEFYI